MIRAGGRIAIKGGTMRIRFGRPVEHRRKWISGEGSILGRLEVTNITLEQNVGDVLWIGDTSPLGAFLRRLIVGGDFDLCNEGGCHWFEDMSDIGIALLEYFRLSNVADDGPIFSRIFETEKVEMAFFVGFFTKKTNTFLGFREQRFKNVKGRRETDRFLQFGHEGGDGSGFVGFVEKGATLSFKDVDKKASLSKFGQKGVGTSFAQLVF